jgi:hypothetical protein
MPCLVRMCGDALKRPDTASGWTPQAWSTFGPHAIGTERSLAVSSGTSFAQVAGAILGKQAPAQNPDKDEVPASTSTLRAAVLGRQPHAEPPHEVRTSCKS